MAEHFSFSKRTEWELTSNKLMSCLEKVRGEDEKIIDLTESNPTHCDFEYPQERILEGFLNPKNMDYRPSAQGLLDARQAICRCYWDRGYEIKPEQIFVTSSTSEAYSFLFRLLTNPGDHVLFPRPSYPLFEFLVDLNDIDMDTYPLIYNKNESQDKHTWQIDFDRFRAAFYPNTKAVVLVNPNNPTGSFIKRDELSAIAEFCMDKNMSIISDEVFWDYSLSENNHEFISAVDNKKCLTFVLGGVSKCLALPQMKVSWIILNGPEELVKEAYNRLEVIADTYLSVNTPAQNALQQWLTLHSMIKGEVVKRLEANYAFVKEAIQKTPSCSCLNAEGGWYVIVKLPNCYSEEHWAMELLTKEHVFVHPGYFFDFYDEPYIVLSLLTPEAEFKEGVGRIINRVALENRL